MMNNNSEGMRLKKLFEELETARRPYESRWKDVYRTVLQKRDNFNSQNSYGPASDSDTEIYSSVATEAWSNLTASLHGGLTNISSKWAKLKILGKFKDKRTAEWFDESSNTVLEVLNSPCYGFPAANFISMQMQTALGTSCMFIEDSLESDFPIRCIDIPIFEVYIDVDAYGEVDTVARKFTLTARQAFQKWGDLVSSNIRSAVDQDPGKRFEFIHVIEPTPMTNAGFGYKGTYLSLQDSTVIERKGYFENPYIVGIFDRIPGEVYGIGRAHHVMPEINMVNQIEKSGLVTMQLQAMSPMLAAGDLVLPEDFQISPGIVIPDSIDDTTGQDKLRRLEAGGPINTLLISIERAEERIRRAFFYDKLLSADSPQKTATEALQIRDERLRNISPYVQRTQMYLDLVFNRVANILLRKGMLSPLPPELSSKGLKRGSTYKIQYLSPMANLAKLEEAQSVAKAIALTGGLVGAKPDMLDWIDSDELMQYCMDSAGLPAKLMADLQDVLKIRSDRQKQAQVQQAMQLAQASSQLQTPIPTQAQ